MVPLVSLFVFLTPQLLLASPMPQMTGEIRSYHQIGDQIKGEFARLHPDGSVTKTMAFGDTKQGLQYKTYQMDPLGNVKSVEMPNQPAQLNQANQAQPQLNQGQPQAQLSGSPGTQATQQAAVSPGVNWFMQQPLVSPVTQALDPFGNDPSIATNPFGQPTFQDPLFSNPVWNWWNF